MKLIDRYFLKHFLAILVFSLMAAMLVFVVVDLIEHLDKFIDRHVPVPVVVDYYILYLPYIIYLVLPVGMLLASLFAMGHFMKTNEFLAMKASGVSLYRIFGWVTLLGLIFSLNHTPRYQTLLCIRMSTKVILLL